MLVGILEDVEFGIPDRREPSVAENLVTIRAKIFAPWCSFMQFDQKLGLCKLHVTAGLCKELKNVMGSIPFTRSIALQGLTQKCK